jgi:hypothetical protein
LKFGGESETREFKTSTGETKEAMDDIVAILNKHGYGELYFGIKKNGEVVGQMVSEKTLRDVSWAIKDHITPAIIPTIERVVIDEKDCVRVLFSGAEAMFSYKTHLEIQMAIFATEERLTFLDISNETGPIIKLVDAAQTYVNKAMRWRAEFGHRCNAKRSPRFPYQQLGKP